jgi:hypothetical protein
MNAHRRLGKIYNNPRVPVTSRVTSELRETVTWRVKL